MRIRNILRGFTRIPALERLDAAQRILDAQIEAEAQGSSLTEEEIRAMAQDAGISLEDRLPALVRGPRGARPRPAMDV